MSKLFSGNKGEWTEPYVLLKLLADQELHFGDEYLNKIKDIVMPIISVVRQEQEYQTVYSYDKDKRNIIISIGETGNSYCAPIENFQENTVKLLNAINNSKSDRTFEIPSIDEFLKNIGCSILKAKSTSKSDIHIVIHDIKTGICPKLGFSIKSELGAGSTLFNASQSTNFTFKIPNWDNKRTTEINSLMNTRGSSDVKGRVQKILEYGYDLEFEGVDKPVFKNNLVMVDSCFPEIISKMLKIYFSGLATNVSDIVAKTCDANPIQYDKEFHHKFYTYKVKHFLNIVALGMLPTQVWQGVYDATGGYLVVKEDGEIVCYHIYSRNEFDNYLFYNTKFDTPSASRNKFGEIYEQNGEFFFKLNFQIRFQ